MSSQKRKSASTQPISSNPLFPAVVALWFGALLGLGSLAVRPSLLENLVLKSHIDLIVPAAAPPLGITARILLALVLAALGAVLGIVLARRLSRPAPEVHERKRGAKDLAAQMPRVRSRDAHPDAPARRPISAHEELGGERSLDEERPTATAPGMLASRRRTLATIDHETAFVPLDMAPLPGVDAVQPLDLAALALPAEPEPQPVPKRLQEPASAATALDWANAAPVAHEAETEHVFLEAANRDGRQIFGLTPPQAPAVTERQIFGVIAVGDHLPQDFVKAAGFQTSVFDTPEPSALFERAGNAPAQAMVAAPPKPLPSFEPLASPATLGMTELAARLADSMRRRRERVEAAAAPALAAEIASELPAMPAAFASPAQLDSVPSAHEARTASAESEAAPIPGLAQFSAAVPIPAEAIAASPRAMPAAMRPLALDAFLVDDTPFDDASLLPPRHIAMPAPVSRPAAFAPPVAEAPAPSEQFAAEEAEQLGADQFGEFSLADTAEDNPYASLLAVAPARQVFVRIDEPEADASEAIEPVVIFPGQAARVVPFGVAATAAGDNHGFRRFDAPALAGQGQPVAAGNVAESGAAMIDPAEAAQALRAALSNLQRMSGAA